MRSLTLEFDGIACSANCHGDVCLDRPNHSTGSRHQTRRACSSKSMLTSTSEVSMTFQLPLFVQNENSVAFLQSQTECAEGKTILIGSIYSFVGHVARLASARFGRQQKKEGPRQRQSADKTHKKRNNDIRIGHELLKERDESYKSYSHVEANGTNEIGSKSSVRSSEGCRR
jgi:hypothetical protein